MKAYIMKKIFLSSILAFGMVIPFVFLSFRPVPKVPAELSRLAAPLAIDLEKAANNWIKTASDFDFKDAFSRTNPEYEYLYYALFNLGEYLDEDIRKSGLKDKEECEKRNDSNSYCYVRSFRNKVIFQVYRSPALREVAYAWLLPDWKRAVTEMDEDRKLLLGKIVNHMVIYTAQFNYGKELSFYNSCRGENEYLFVSEYPVKNGEEDYDSENTNPYRRAEAWVFRRIHQKQMTIGEITKWFSRIKKDLALPEADESVVFYPKNGNQFYASGQEKLEKKDYQGAISDFSKGIDLFSKSRVGLSKADAQIMFNSSYAKIQLDDFQGAVSDLDKAIKLSPDKPESYFFNKGFAHYQMNNYREAVSDFTMALKHDPENESTYLFRANSNFSLKEYQGAIDDYTKLIGLKPFNDGFYYERGKAWSELNQNENAVRDFTLAINMNGENSKAFFDRGRIKYSMNDYEGAMRDISTGLKFDPSSTNGYYLKGLVNHRLKEYKMAIADYDTVLKYNPEYGTGYRNRGYSKTRIKDFPGAIADYNKAIALQPDIADNYYAISFVYLSMENHPLAIEYARKGLEKSPDDPELYGILGYSYFSAENITSAKESFLKSLELRKENSEVLLGLSVCCFMLKETDNAEKYYGEAKQLQTKYAKGLEGIALMESEGYFYPELFKVQFEKMIKKLIRK